MTRKEQIVELLKENGFMTQEEIAVAIYGDKMKYSNVQEPLSGLVRENIVTRKDGRPFQYSLIEEY